MLSGKETSDPCSTIRRPRDLIAWPLLSPSRMTACSSDCGRSKYTTSHTRFRRAAFFRKRRISVSATSPWPSLIPISERFFRSSVHIRAERSTKVASIAPRDIASIPIVPTPEPRSSIRPPFTRLDMTLKTISRSLRSVWAAFGDGEFCSFWPRKRPSVICPSDVIFIWFSATTGLPVRGRPR